MLSECEQLLPCRGILDPVLSYSTYLGGNGADGAAGIAVDSSGNIYVAGTTFSPASGGGEFPRVNAYQNAKLGNYDAFVTKISSSGTLLYSTYLGGNSLENGFAIAADNAGNAYVTGLTQSSDFPTTANAFQPAKGDGSEFLTDCFVTKLNTNLSGAVSLVYSTYLGGLSIEEGYGIAADSAGHAYVTGYTASSTFPFRNGVQGFQSRVDAFVTKLDTTASGDASLLSPELIAGKAACTGVDGTLSFTGLLDELEIFNRALSTSEIQSIANAGSAGKCRTCTPPPSGMTAWWAGDGNANDIQGSNNGTLMNGATIATGEVGQAFSFDGVNDFVDVPTSSGLPISTWTIDFWFFLNSNTTSQTFVTNFDGSGSRYIIEYHATLGLRLGHFATFPDLNSSVKPSAGVWHHLTAIQSTNPGIGQSLYLDGNLIGTAGANIADPTIHLKFGQRGDGTFFLNGLLDEIEIFNRALSASEIQAIVNAGSAGKCKNRPPVAMCNAVTVSAGANCTANASIDNGSSDPDGDAITLTQSPAGPYPLGNTSVTLTVTDSRGTSSTCSATVTVIDTTPPQITAPANASYQCASQVPAGDPSQATATDNCGTPTITVADASNGGAGSTASPLVITRVFTATDAAGNSASAAQTITVNDNIQPTITVCAAPQSADANASCQAAVPDFTGGVTTTDNCTAGGR